MPTTWVDQRKGRLVIHTGDPYGTHQRGTKLPDQEQRAEESPCNPDRNKEV